MKKRYAQREYPPKELTDDQKRPKPSVNQRLMNLQNKIDKEMERKKPKYMMYAYINLACWTVVIIYCILKFIFKII